MTCADLSDRTALMPACRTPTMSSHWCQGVAQFSSSRHTHRPPPPPPPNPQPPPPANPHTPPPPHTPRPPPPPPPPKPPTPPTPPPPPPPPNPNPYQTPQHPPPPPPPPSKDPSPLTPPHKPPHLPSNPSPTTPPRDSPAQTPQKSRKLRSGWGAAAHVTPPLRRVAATPPSRIHPRIGLSEVYFSSGGIERSDVCPSSDAALVHLAAGGCAAPRRLEAWLSPPFSYQSSQITRAYRPWVCVSPSERCWF